MTMPFKPAPTAALMLADGMVFFGYGIGAIGTTSGEICFNTAMTGYQEILTDPSYAGQIITFTFPHIGNVGVNAQDVESSSAAAHSSVPLPLRERLGEGAGSAADDFHTPPSNLPSQEGKASLAAPLGAHGLIVREPITEPSSFRATAHLDAWLKARGVTGISGIDTRALVRHIRTYGAQNCAIAYEEVASRQAPVAREILLKKAKAALAQAPDMNGLELAAHVTTKENFVWEEKRWALDAGKTQQVMTDEKAVRSASEPQSGGVSVLERSGKDELASQAKGQRAPSLCHVVAIDYGVKLNILRSLASTGMRLTVVPATTTAEEILALNPDGVFLSNGPGDPAATGSYAVPVIKKMIASGVPLFGICLGHQMLGIALGCRTEKMNQGHRGANHPVKDLHTGKVEITSQNHGFAISDAGLPEEVEVTHRSLFDGTIQGIRVKGKPIFSVQGHPEASPGPHDAQYLFDRFMALMTKKKKVA